MSALSFGDRLVCNLSACPTCFVASEAFTGVNDKGPGSAPNAISADNSFCVCFYCGELCRVVKDDDKTWIRKVTKEEVRKLQASNVWALLTRLIAKFRSDANPVRFRRLCDKAGTAWDNSRIAAELLKGDGNDKDPD